MNHFRLICWYCNKEFRQDFARMYCSIKCKDKATKRRQANPLFHDCVRTCHFCKIKFTCINDKRRFCDKCKQIPKLYCFECSRIFEARKIVDGLCIDCTARLEKKKGKLLGLLDWESEIWAKQTLESGLK